MSLLFFVNILLQVFVPSLGRERQTTQSKLKRLRSPQNSSSPAAKPSRSQPSAATSYASPLPSPQVYATSSGAPSDWPGVDASTPPAVYSYHRSLPQVPEDANTAHSVSPWAAAAWTVGKSDGGYAEIVDGVYGGGGAVGIKPKNVEEEAAMYAKMLRATAAFEKVTGATEGAPQAFEVSRSPHVMQGYNAFPEPTRAQALVSARQGGDGVYRGGATTARSLFSSAWLRRYRSGGQAYRSLDSVHEYKVHDGNYDDDLSNDTATRPRQASDLICNPVSCCSVS